MHLYPPEDEIFLALSEFNLNCFISYLYNRSKSFLLVII